jgi:hypothetical protein
MATCTDKRRAALGDPTPVTGGRRLAPRPLRKAPKVRHVPQDDLGRHLLTMFLLHPTVMERFSGPSETLDDVGERLCAMTDRAKHQLLARVERLLGVPRVVQNHLEQVCA